LISINWRWIVYLLIIIILCVSALCITNASAISYEEYLEKYDKGIKAPMATDEMIAKNGSHEVYQMDTVYWGDIVDLTLVSGWSGKVYHEDLGNIVDISSFTHRIYIDPNIFPIGTWHQWSDFDEDAGNTVAFYVRSSRPIKNETASPIETPNVTLKPYIQPIPVKKVTDILVARGDPLSISFKKAKLWIFGTKSGYYDFMTVNDAITLNKSQIQSLEPGTYVLLAEFPNEKTAQFNMRYDAAKDRLEYFDPNQFKIVYLDFAGLDPTTRLAKFRSVRNTSTDNFVEYKMIVEDPMIEITSLDQVYINDTVFAQTVKGYTNVGIGDELTFKVDQEKTDRYNTFFTVAKGSGNPGEMRWFEITVPLLWENFAPGHHTIVGTTALGGSMSVGFDVYESPEHSFIPNNTIKYVNGSEWKEPVIIEKTVTIILPTPTPITVIQTVKVPPPQESVDAAQAKAVNTLAVNVIIIVVAVILCILIFMYWRSVHCRVRDRKREWK
jgi:hypothetical protein